MFLVPHIGLYKSLTRPMHVPTTWVLRDLVPHLAWPSASLLQLIHVKYSSSNGKGMQHLLSVVYTMTDAHLCTSGWIEIKDWRKDATDYCEQAFPNYADII